MHVRRGDKFGPLKHAVIELLCYRHDIGLSGRADVTVASFQDTADDSDLKNTVFFRHRA
jgi:hypothetical protein